MAQPTTTAGMAKPAIATPAEVLTDGHLKHITTCLVAMFVDDAILTGQQRTTLGHTVALLDLLRTRVGRARYDETRHGASIITFNCLACGSTEPRIRGGRLIGDTTYPCTDDWHETTDRDELRDRVDRLTAALQVELGEHPATAHWCSGFAAWMGSDQQDRGDCRVRRRLLAALNTAIINEPETTR